MVTGDWFTTEITIRNRYCVNPWLGKYLESFSLTMRHLMYSCCCRNLLQCYHEAASIMIPSFKQHEDEVEMKTTST